MSEAVEDLQQTDNEAMASITAGYNKQRGDAPEVEVEVATETEAVETESEPEPAPAAPTLEEKLSELASRVAQFDDTPTQISKLHGKIGELNRTMLGLQQQGSGAPSAELAEALTQAEAVAADFPELAGPLVAAIKALGTGRQAAPAAPTVDVDAVVAERVSKLRQQEAIEELSLDHPDWQQLRDNPPPEYKAWLESKPKEFRDRYLNTWNPNVISRALTEYKSSIAAAKAEKERKQARMEAAITPEGEGSPGPSKLSDSAGLTVGYNKVRRLNSAR